MTVAELIAALEAAEGSSRELDAEIGLLVTPSLRAYPRSEVIFASYTSSIDAALTLVPGGWICNMYRVRGALTPLVYLYDDRSQRPVPWEEDGVIGASGATSAIAICIAALKARNAP